MTAGSVGCVVELGARLGDWALDHFQPAPDLETFASVAAGLGPVELTRMSNRMRDTVHALRQLGSYPYLADADRVPAAALGEVWDAPVRVWQHAGKTTHITAVTVHARLYLNHHGGPPSYEMPRYRFGAQVIARAAAAGQPDAFAVFWRPEIESNGWRQVTGELPEADMVAWDGRPARYDDQHAVMTELAAWLDQVTADAPRAYVSGWAGALAGGAR